MFCSKSVVSEHRIEDWQRWGACTWEGLGEVLAGSYWRHREGAAHHQCEISPPPGLSQGPALRGKLQRQGQPGPQEPLTWDKDGARGLEHPQHRGHCSGGDGERLPPKLLSALCPWSRDSSVTVTSMAKSPSPLKGRDRCI